MCLKTAANHRTPTIVDNDAAGPGPPVSVFELGAFLLDLAAKTGKFRLADRHGSAEALQWLFRQMAGRGPMASHTVSE